jgi:hypothetical protein
MIGLDVQEQHQQSAVQVDRVQVVIHRKQAQVQVNLFALRVHRPGIIINVSDRHVIVCSTANETI